MPFNLPSHKHSTENLIQKDIDTEKYARITTLLCEKRKAIEASLSEATIEQTIREEKALALIQIKQDLLAFGVSEVDYLAYKEKTKEVQVVSDDQMKLF